VLYTFVSDQLRAATTQVAALGSVALYTAYYVGEAKVAAITLYAVVGTLAAVWAIAFGVMLLTMDRKYVRTFFSTQTARGFVMDHFLDNDGNDECRAQIFTNNQEQWRPIRPQVQAWLRSRFKVWRRTKPAWFTAALLASIPTDMLPPRDETWLEKARGQRPSIHDAGASLAQRLSLVVPSESAAESTPAPARNQVMPHGLGRGSGETGTEEAELQAAIQRSMATQTHRRQPAAEARNLTQWVLRVQVCFVRPLNPLCRHLHPSAVSTLR
jgi:hypothetical protein